MKDTRLQQLLTFLKEDPDDPFTLYSIAYEYVIQEDFKQAIIFFERLKHKHPNYIGLYLHLGKSYEKINNSEQALKIYTQGLNISTIKNRPRAHSELQQAIRDLQEDEWDI